MKVLALAAALALQPSPPPEAGPPALSPDVLGEHLPSAFVAAVSSRLRVVLHHSPDDATAYYLPPVPGPETAARALSREPGGAAAQPSPSEPLPEGGAQSGTDAALQSRLLPMLVLYEPYLARQGQLVKAVELPVDSAEYLFHALLQAYLDLEVLSQESGYGELLRARAEALMSDLPAAHRIEAYANAVASFGSHLLSVANELERSHRRLQKRGADLCGELERPVGLLALWERSFGEGSYPGSYFAPLGESPAETDEEPTAGQSRGDAASTPRSSPSEVAYRPVYSTRVLTRRDKELFVHHVLEGRWTGEPRPDFGDRYCPEAKGARQE